MCIDIRPGSNRDRGKSPDRCQLILNSPSVSWNAKELLTDKRPCATINIRPCLRVRKNYITPFVYIAMMLISDWHVVDRCLVSVTVWSDVHGAMTYYNFVQ